MSPYVVALLAALAFALGTTLQQRGTLDAEAAEGDPRFLLQIVRMPVWLAGAGMQAAGWVLQAVALDTGSLVVVQSLTTLSLVFALPLGARLTGQRIGRRAILGAAMATFGIAAFLVSGQPQSGTTQPDAVTLLLWGALVVAGMAALAWLGARRRGPTAAALFATAAGISFGLQAAATKVFVTQLGQGLLALLTNLTPYLLILSALAGFGLQQSALKTGFLAPAMAASNAATLATSVLLGVVLFGETVAAGSDRLPLALASLAVAVVGVVILAQPEKAAGTTA